MYDGDPSRPRLRVVGVGGAGGNAVARMSTHGIDGVDLLAINTDLQALAQLKGTQTFAIGPRTTGGMGSGGRAETGRKAINESRAQIARLIEGADMVFITAGMGGGTGTGASAVVAEIAKKQGALTVGVVTLPFAFEGPDRRTVAQAGLDQLMHKVDTLIVAENDRLLPALKTDVSLGDAFRAADEVLRQGVQGISEILTSAGIVNVDFADVKAVMTNGGPSFMAVAEAKGKGAAIEAAGAALSNPLFEAPVQGASGILLNVRGGKDLTLAQVHEVAAIVRSTANPECNIIFGVVQDKRLKRRVRVTLVATGVDRTQQSAFQASAEPQLHAAAETLPGVAARANGHHTPVTIGGSRLL
ncbi:MAG: cell division protein FtsZ [Chloroflexi bacterium]|nr:cell division protein FtsZ [Chloroflexota bacterium]